MSKFDKKPNKQPTTYLDFRFCTDPVFRISGSGRWGTASFLFACCEVLTFLFPRKFNEYFDTSDRESGDLEGCNHLVDGSSGLQLDKWLPANFAEAIRDIKNSPPPTLVGRCIAVLEREDRARGIDTTTDALALLGWSTDGMAYEGKEGKNEGD